MSRVVLNRTAGDFGDTITLPLQEEDGTASDLTGQTAVRLHIRLEGDIPGVDALRVDGAMTVEGAETLGIVSYVVVDGDFDIAGIYLGQVEAVFPTRQVTWDILIVNVAEQHG